MKFKTYLKENKQLLIIIVCMIVIVFGVWIFSFEDFILGYDFKDQHLYFYQEFHRLIYSRQMPFWSNNMLLGTNFYASKVYYLLGDPYAYLTLLFSLEHLTKGLLLTYIFKFLTAALAMNQLLRKIGIDAKKRIIPVLLYTFCGWAMLFAEHPMFLTWFSFLPFIMLGLEKVIREKKYSLFIISVFLIFVSNYYFFWTTSVFLIYYWTIRYFQYNKISIKIYIVETLKLIFAYFVGVLMAMFLMLPAILHLLQNTRISQDFIVVARWLPYSIYLDMLVKAFIAPFKVSNQGFLLFNSGEYAVNQLTLYCSVFSLLILPQILTYKNKKYRNGYLLLFFINLCFLLTHFGSSLMHGLSEATFRWTLLFIFSEIIIVAEILQHVQINKKLLVSTSIFLCCVCLGLRTLALPRIINLSANYQGEYIALLISAGLVILYTLFIWKNPNKLTYLLMAELIVSSILTLQRYPQQGKMNSEIEDLKEVICTIKDKESESSFYRIYIPFSDMGSSPYNLNLSLDFKGAYGYDSLPQFPVYQYLYDVQATSSDNRLLQIQDLEAWKELNFKYFVVKNPEFSIEAEAGVSRISLLDYPEFEWIDEVNGYQIFINNDVKDFPIDTMILKDSYIKGNIQVESDQIIIVPIAYDQGWRCMIDSEEVEILNQKGLIGVFLKKGSYEIILKFEPQGLKTGCLISCLGLLIFVIIHKREKNV